MMAAISAARRGHRVTLYEKNEKLGKKLFLTGKGRCNLTNSGGEDAFFQNVVTNPKFLYSAWDAFPGQSTCAFFESIGCPLKVERGQRVFPASDHSSDVIRALEGELARCGVRVECNVHVGRVLADSSGKAVTGLQVNGRRLGADWVILATGGLSYPATGSNGEGLRMARELGHSVTECVPALSPLSTKEGWCARLQGLSLRNVALALEISGKELYRGFGEMLFTHFGISGPLVLTASSYWASAVRKDPDAQGKIFLNVKPALTPRQLDLRLARDLEENHSRQFKNALAGLFPGRLIPVMVLLSDIDPEKRAGEVTRLERARLAALIQRLPLTIDRIGQWREAVITQGGVDVRQVDPSTMRSKRVDRLSFAGEMLDVDALTGGFNLQIAWSTGFLAGQRCGDP